MIVPLLLAAAFAAGVDPRRLALLAAATYLPLITGVLVVWFMWRSRPDADNRPALFCESVSSELRAGATLHQALSTAATSVGLIVPASPPNIAGLADSLAAELADIGDEVRIIVESASRSGSDTAPLFDEIGSLAIARSEIRHEIRVATAPGRATALVLIGAPLVYLGSRLSSGGLEQMLATQAQRTVFLAGMAVFVLGLVLAVTVVVRAGR